jgi:hypothetical protein
MMTLNLLVTVTPDSDPAITAKFAYDVETMYRAMHDTRPDEPDDDDVVLDVGVEDLTRRWISFAPSNAEAIRAVMRALAGLGYTLALPASRSGGGARTYLRALRPDGANLGYANSASFTFVGSAGIAEGRPGVESGDEHRYPVVRWSTPGAVERVLDIALDYLRA